MTGNIDETKIIQKYELEILKRIRKICDENGIAYFLSDGTLLGAVRHKGFIPWDDDVDVAIPRPDYERFIHAAVKSFTDPYEVLIPNKTKGYLFPFVKIIDKRVKVRTASREKEQIWNVWVDIFPLDVMPENKVRFFIRKYHLLYRRMMYMFSCFDDMASIDRPDRPFIERILIRFAKIIHPDRYLDTSVQIEKYNQALMSLPYDKGNQIISFHGAYKFRSLMDKSVYGTPDKLLFEGDFYSVPEQYEKYLSTLYGDFMQLPPENKRNQHKLELIQIKSE